MSHSGGPSLITWVLKTRDSSWLSQRDVVWERLDPSLLALKVEEGTHGPRNVVVFRSWECSSAYSQQENEKLGLTTVRNWFCQQHRWTRNLRFKHEHKDATSSWNISGDHYTQVWTNLLATPIQSSFPGSPHLLPEALHTTTRLQLSNSPPLEKSKNFTEALETYFWAPWSLSTTMVHNMTASIVFLPR